MGYYTVLCDYLEDNPGQYIADCFYLVSTVDKNAVLEVAREEKIDGILAYASDPAAPTAAYVAEQLNLPGNPYSSVEILCNKDYFRAFLKENSFCTPKSCGYCDINVALLDLQSNRFQLPVVVKPVDSSGSKGVSRIDKVDEAWEKLSHAMALSYGKRIIIEEYVEKFGYQIAGDGFSIDGRLVFHCFANDHFDSKCINPFVPVSASFPYNMQKKLHNKIHAEIQRLLTILDMKTSAYNFDIRVDENYNIYLMEIAPRNGGNYIPQIIQYATGIDLVKCSIKAALGESIEIPKNCSCKGFWSYFAVHSLKEGILDDIEIDPTVFAHNIVETYLIKKSGDSVRRFRGANDTLGCLIMKFDNMTEMLDMMDHSENWCHVRLR